MGNFLFTSVPLQLAREFTKTAIPRSTDPLPLQTEDIVNSLNLWLTSSYFQYNGKHYERLHGNCTCIEEKEAPFQLTDKRYRFGYATFRYIHRRRTRRVKAFYHHLNGQNNNIQFAREVEENGKLLFLDW